MKLSVRNAQGKQVRRITVEDIVFGITPNLAVLHQAFVAQRANQRRGSASTKSRGEVQGSTRKIRGQKYTGRARQGSARSPIRVGGGVAFGPRPRSYRQALPKKMRRLAIRSALSGKVADGQLHIVDKLGFERPRTKDVSHVLHNVGIERSALIVTSTPDRSVLVSARNLPKTKVLPAAYLNVVDMLTHRDLLLTEDAVRSVEGLWGGAAAKPTVVESPKPRRRRAAAAKEPAADVEAPAADKPRRRRAAPKAEAVVDPPKPRRKRAPAVKASVAELETPVEEKPRRRRAAPKAQAAAEPAKPARRTRRPKAEAEDKPTERTEDKPKRARRRTPAKKEEA
jgi:large subunit ribosomal protein L4